MNGEIRLTFQEIIDHCGCEDSWLCALIAENALPIREDPRAHLFDDRELGIIRRAQRLGRDFDASPAALALILELLEERDRLRHALCGHSY